MALQSNTGEVTGTTVLFRKVQKRPLPLERRVPDGSGIVRQMARGGVQELLLYVGAVTGAVSVNSVEAYVPALDTWVDLSITAGPVAAGDGIRVPISTFPPETQIRVTMSDDTNDHIVEAYPYVP